MSFNQNIHIEQDIEERLDLYWDFKPSDGGVRNQKYVVMSIVAPEGTNQRAPSFGIKVFGCFATQEEAAAYCTKLQGECNFFDYYVMETLEWAKLPPVVERLEDVHYQEQELETLKNNVIQMRQNRAKIMEQRVLEARGPEQQEGRQGDVDEGLGDHGRHIVHGGTAAHCSAAPVAA